jgi:hypothetical protein
MTPPSIGPVAACGCREDVSSSSPLSAACEPGSRDNASANQFRAASALA